MGGRLESGTFARAGVSIAVMHIDRVAMTAGKDRHYIPVSIIRYQLTCAQ